MEINKSRAGDNLLILPEEDIAGLLCSDRLRNAAVKCVCSSTQLTVLFEISAGSSSRLKNEEAGRRSPYGWHTCGPPPRGIYYESWDLNTVWNKFHKVFNDAVYQKSANRVSRIYINSKIGMSRLSKLNARRTVALKKECRNSSNLATVTWDQCVTIHTQNSNHQQQVRWVLAAGNVRRSSVRQLPIRRHRP